MTNPSPPVKLGSVSYPTNINTAGSTITIASAGTSSPTISNLGKTIHSSSINGEDMFEFLKDNLRVAEYIDDDGKLLYVELQMRAAPGFVWDKIRRVRLKETDDML